MSDIVQILDDLIKKYPPQERKWLVYNPADLAILREVGNTRIPPETIGYFTGGIPTWETPHQPYGQIAAVPESEMIFYLARLSRVAVEEWVKYRAPIEQRQWEAQLETRRAIARSQGYVFPEDEQSGK